MVDGRGRVGVLGSVVFVIALFLVPPVPAQPTELGGIHLDSWVRQSLRRLQDGWQAWTTAYYQGEADEAAAEVDDMLGVANSLGLETLPDLSVAAAALAVRSAREGDLDRAVWTLESARRLDPTRPETSFAGVSVNFDRGNWLGAASDLIAGYRSLLALPLERRLLIANTVVWIMYSVLAAGAFFVALAMAIRGGRILGDLAAMMSPPLPRVAAWSTIVAILLLPLFLPVGAVWVLLALSILVWAWGTVGERVVVTGLWIVLALVPVVLELQRVALEQHLSAPSRMIESLQAGRLYGAVFSDLQKVRGMTDNSPAVDELVADLYRRFGQWERAYPLYRDLAEEEPTLAVLVNLGAYHHLRGEYSQAIDYFTQAVATDSASAVAHFNLSQSLSRSYAFTDSRNALAEARRYGGSRVDAWMDGSDESAREVIPIEGGLARVDEIRSSLAPSEISPKALFTRHTVGFAVVLVALLVAVLLDLVRRRWVPVTLEDETAPPLPDPWLRALVPGLAAVLQGRGVTAFLALLLPVAVLLAPFSERFAYRMPIAVGPGPWVAISLTIVTLTVLVVVRFSAVLGARGRR